jgi:tetratricopeptide (TPR) repeat protein
MAAATAPTAPQVLEDIPLKSIFQIPEHALDAVMAAAYQLYQVGRYPEVEILCRGLIAADHKYWWSYSLYAATLRRLGRLDEALEQLDKGLAHEPAATKLLTMRDELRQVVGGRTDTPSTSNTHSDDQVAA